MIVKIFDEYTSLCQSFIIIFCHNYFSVFKIDQLKRFKAHHMQRNSRNLEEKVSLDSIKDRQFQVHYLNTKIILYYWIFFCKIQATCITWEMCSLLSDCCDKLTEFTAINMTEQAYCSEQWTIQVYCINTLTSRSSM